MFRKWKRDFQNKPNGTRKAILMMVLGVSMIFQPLLPTVTAAIGSSHIGAWNIQSVQDDESINPLIDHIQTMALHLNDFLSGLEVFSDKDLTEGMDPPVVTTYGVAHEYEPSYDDDEDDLSKRNEDLVDRLDEESDLTLTEILTIEELSIDRRHPNLTAREALRLDYENDDVQFMTVGEDGYTLHYDGLELDFPDDLAERLAIPELNAVWEIGIHPLAEQSLDLSALDTDFGTRRIQSNQRVEPHELMEAFTVRMDGTTMHAICGQRWLHGPATGAAFRPVETRNNDLRAVFWYAMHLFNNGNPLTVGSLTLDEQLAMQLNSTWFNNYGSESARRFSTNINPWTVNGVSRYTANSAGHLRVFNHSQTTQLYDLVSNRGNNSSVPSMPSRDGGDFRVYRLITDASDIQDLFASFYDPFDPGYVGVRKATNSTSIMNAIGGSLEGAIFGAWETHSAAVAGTDARRLGRWRTDSNGVGQVVRGGTSASDQTGYTRLTFEIGDVVYIRELSAPPGHILYTGVQRVVVGSASNSSSTSRGSISRSGENMTVTITNIPEVGELRVNKASNNPALVNINPNYDIAGAQFALFTTQAAAQTATTSNTAFTNGSVTGSIARWTTNDQGYGILTHVSGVASGSTIGNRSVIVPPGTYWVVENVAPPGHSRVLTVHQVTVQAGDTGNDRVVTVTNQALLYQMQLLRKLDSVTGEIPQGNATLQGAEFTLRFFHNNNWGGTPALTLIYRTNADGRIDFTNPSHLVPGQTVPLMFTTSTGAINIPLGTLTLEETRAPQGFIRDTSVYRARIVEINTAPGIAFQWEEEPNPNRVTYNSNTGLTFNNTVIRGGTYVIKYDRERDETVPQGNATLAGSQIAIYNRSRNPIVTLDNRTIQPGGRVMVITTNAQGRAETALRDLPYGRYELMEIVAPTGYLVNPSWRAWVTITQEAVRVPARYNQQGNLINFIARHLDQQVMRGSFEIPKFDAGNNTCISQGDASLEGARIAIYNQSSHGVRLLSNGAWNATTNQFTGTLGLVVPTGGRVMTIVTDTDGIARVPRYSLPFGTYRLVEINPSTGYLINNGWNTTITINQNRQHITFPCTQGLPQDVMLGGVIVRKADWDRVILGQENTSIPQGDARLNATFAIYNISDNPIRPFGTGNSVAVGARVTTITADPITGIAQTPTQVGNRPNNTANESPRQMLPYGTYRIVEIDPITGYHVTHPNVNNGQPWEREFTIRYHGQIVDLIGDPAINVVYRNNIMIEKRDAELRISDGMSGPDSLAGIQYAIYNRSDREILYRPHGVAPRWIAPGSRVTVITTEWNELAQAYTAQTRGQMIDGYYHAALPFGRYEVVELGHRDGWGTDRANEFYYFTDRAIRHVTIRTPFTWEHDSHETATNADPDNFYRETANNDPLNWYNYNIRNDFRFVKIAESFAHRMDVPWALTNITTGETQILVTNRNGEFRSYHGWNHNRDNLNTRVVENFLAVDPNEITEEMIIDWLENPYDEHDRRREINMADLHEHSGVWFGRGYRTGAQAPVRNSLQFGALTYGQYILRELPSDTNAPNDLNEGYHLQVIEFEIMRSLPGNTGGSGNNSTLANGRPVYTIELGTVTNWETHVWSEAEDVDTRTQMSFARPGEVIITDRVWYRGLIPGVNYVVRGFAMEYPSGRMLMVDGEMVESRTTITALSTTIPRSVNLTFIFDGSEMAGRTIVFGAHIYREDTGQLVAVHRDITDEDQTILFPTIKTVLTDAETGIDLIYANGEVTVNERIEWSNLMANRRYTLTSYLYDANTGERFMGPERHEFTTRGSGLRATPNEGYADIQFTFNADTLAGRSLVAVTTLTHNNMTLAESVELTNEDQMVRFPDVKTMLVDDRYGVDIINAEGEVTLVDYVFIYNVIPGREYIVCGRLIDTETLEEFHESVCVTFVPNTADNVQRVEFTFDASDLAGRSLVAFERLYYSANNETNPSDEDILIGTHEDPEDEYQTVYFPRLKTTAFDVMTGTQAGILAPSITVRDRVYFWNLIPGRTFTIRGAMIDRDTGEAILYNGEPVTSEVTFVPEEADGYADLYFTLDSSDMAGGQIVIFESLYYRPDGRPDTPGDTDIPTERPELPEDGILVGEHHDPEDDYQTIWFPEMEISTQAWTGEEPNQYFNPWDSEIEIHDNIRMIFRNIPERVTFEAAYQATAWGVVPAGTSMGDISYDDNNPDFPDQYVFRIWVSPRNRITVTGNETGEIVIDTSVSTTIDPRQLPPGTRIFWSEVLYRVIDPEAPVICPPTSTPPGIVPCVPEYNPETGEYEYPEDCVPDCIVDDYYYPQYDHNKDGNDRNQDLWPIRRPAVPTPEPTPTPPRLPQTGFGDSWMTLTILGGLMIVTGIVVVKVWRVKKSQM